MLTASGQCPPGVLREVLDGLPQAILVIDGEGRVCFGNQAASALFARRALVAENSDWGSLRRAIGPLRRLNGAPLDDSELPWPRLERGEAFQDYELRSAERWETGRPVFSFSGRTFRQPDTGELRRILTIEDASHRYDSESLFRTAFERGPVPVTLVRSSDERVVDANNAFLELVGYERWEVVGHTVPELALILDHEDLKGTRERLARGEDVERVELVLRCRDGLARTLLSWYRWVEVGGEECLLGVYLDMTEQKEMERKLREATQVVLQSASMFSRSVVQQLERLRAPDRSGVVTGELDLLTRRERDVVTRVGAGHSNHKIAVELALTPQTIRNYVTRIYRKIGVANRAEAVVWARERGLVQG